MSDWFFSHAAFVISDVSTDKYKGYPAFIGSIVGIGVLTAIIGDVASHFGCFSRIRDSVTAITIVALGTSVPGAKNHCSWMFFSGKIFIYGRWSIKLLFEVVFGTDEPSSASFRLFLVFQTTIQIYCNKVQISIYL